MQTLNVQFQSFEAFVFVHVVSVRPRHREMSQAQASSPSWRRVTPSVHRSSAESLEGKALAQVVHQQPEACTSNRTLAAQQQRQTRLLSCSFAQASTGRPSEVY